MNEEHLRSFATQKGVRGAHFSDEDGCNFVRWDDVVRHTQALRAASPEDCEFEEKLLTAIANINPENEYILVRKISDHEISIECFRRVRP